MGLGAAAVLLAVAAPLGAATEEAKLTDPAGTIDDFLGTSVAVSGGTLLAGAYLDTGSFDRDGSATLFERDPGGAEPWVLARKLVAADPSVAAFFGFSVDLDGNTAVVGAYGADAAYVFERDLGGAENWGQAARLTGSDTLPGDQFGISVAIDGDVVVIGSHRHGEIGQQAGSAYVFERDQGGADAWGEVGELLASDGADFDAFGRAVAVSGDRIAVGSILHDATGAVYLYERAPAPLAGWVEATTLTPSDEGGRFGFSVAIDGDTVLAGANLNSNSNGTAAGAAYVFERDQGGPGAWGEVAKLVASDGGAFEEFGECVALEGDVALVGAEEHNLVRGAVYVYERDAGGEDAWGETSEIEASDGEIGDACGASVDLSGNTMVTGAPGVDDPLDDSGAVYVILMDAALWLTGVCPGPLTVGVAGVTPGADIVLAWSPDLGDSTVPVGVCEGTPLDLATPAPLGTLPADASGQVSFSANAPETACGARLQALDLDTCGVTNTAQVP